MDSVLLPGQGTPLPNPARRSDLGLPDTRSPFGTVLNYAGSLLEQHPTAVSLLGLRVLGPLQLTLSHNSPGARCPPSDTLSSTYPGIPSLSCNAVSGGHVTYSVLLNTSSVDATVTDVQRLRDRLEFDTGEAGLFGPQLAQLTVAGSLLNPDRSFYTALRLNARALEGGLASGAVVGAAQCDSMLLFDPVLPPSHAFEGVIIALLFFSVFSTLKSTYFARRRLKWHADAIVEGRSPWAWTYDGLLAGLMIALLTMDTRCR